LGDSPDGAKVALQPDQRAILISGSSGAGKSRLTTLLVERLVESRYHIVHLRHTRKYAEGRLGEDISFYFRGPDNALNLRAYNLASYLELAKGVDDATWLFHLKRGDYTRWFGDIIKDDDLADDARSAETIAESNESRAAVTEAIKKRYIVTAT
jgi:hypothetical protein